MFKRIVCNFSLASVFNGSVFTMGFDRHDALIVAIVCLAVLIVSILKEKNINIRENISKKNIIVRWTLYYALILFIIIFGAYGTGYKPVDPLYANF